MTTIAQCDEALPVCGQCKRTHVKCSFEDSADAQSFTTTNNIDRLAAATPSSTRGSVTSADAEQAVNQTDLEIYNNWIMNTASGVLPVESTASCLTQRTTELVLRSPYLLHGAMAISALQIYFGDPSRGELLFRASYLQSTALTAARPHIASLSEDESIPMLFFAGFTATYSLAESSLQMQSGGRQESNAVSRIMESFQLVRGIRTVLEPHWRHLKESWVAPILQLAITSGAEEDAHKTILPDEKMLRSLALGLDSSIQRRSCFNAIDELSSSIQVVQHSTNRLLNARMVMKWPASVDMTLESLILQHKPIGLVIMAYYAVLLHISRDTWWVSRWPPILLNYIEEYLGEEWAELLSWPKQIIRDTRIR